MGCCILLPLARGDNLWRGFGYFWLFWGDFYCHVGQHFYISVHQKIEFSEALTKLELI